MAEKRMLTMKICDSDAFLEMPLSTQCLYFHLNMRADDDGFIGIEIDDKWHKISVDRLNGINTKGQTSIFTDFDNM